MGFLNASTYRNINICCSFVSKYINISLIYRWGVDLVYKSTTVENEIGIIMVGNSIAPFIFVCMILIFWVIQKFVKRVPKLAYKFASAYGIACLIDFEIVMIVDIASLVYKFYIKINDLEF